MKFFGALAFLLLMGVALHASDSLKVARELAKTKYGGWTYGPDPSKNQVDCTQFVQAVLTDMNVPLDSTAKKAININYHFDKGIEEAVRKGDDRTRGVHYALIDLLKKGKDVSPSKAQPGDFIQYWIFRGDRLIGHSAIIHKIIEDKSGNRAAELYGAHETPKPKGTIGLAVTEPVKLEGADRKVYIARLTD